MVSVLIPVSVTITVAASFGTVQDDCHVLETFLLVSALQFGQHVALQQAGTDDEEGAVGKFLDDLRVRYNLDGRTVDEDAVVFVPHPFYQRAQARFGKQFGRIGRDGAHGQDVQPGIAGHLLYQCLRILFPFA